jgi:hypothetical protein
VERELAGGGRAKENPAEWRGEKEDEKILTVRGEIFSGGNF